MDGFYEKNEIILYHNMWPNAFKSLELAFKGNDIRDNLKEVIKLQIDASPFEDIQIYKFDKKSGDLITNLKLDDKNDLLNSYNIESIGEFDKNIKHIDEKGKTHYLDIAKYSNKYNDYVIVIENKKLFESTPEKYCDEIIKRTWRLILDKLSYQDVIREAYITDPLTKVGNRTYYQEVTRKIFEEGKKELTYSLIDLFRLKFVNDNFGHKYGDEYIKKAAQYLGEELDSDDQLFRIGGDEFVIISGKAKKKVMIEKIKEANLKLNRETLGVDISFPLNINYGIYEGEEDLDTFYTRADARLSKQKSKTYKMLNIDRRR